MLDFDQVRAVNAPLKNNLVVANAGSGKTRVLTYRVKYLIEKNVSPSSIVLLTFTNKAASEMVNRVKNLLNFNMNILAGTFHHVAVVFLRRYGTEIGIPRNFTVLPTEEAKDLMFLARQSFIAKNPGIDKKKVPDKSVLLFLNSESINKNIELEKLSLIKGFCNDSINYIQTIILGYKERKEYLDALDFDDLIVRFAELLENEHVKPKINRIYKHILVDEYQDINWIQNRIIENLNGSDMLYAVGDGEQAIYGFRGSDNGFIRNFEESHPGCDIYKIRFNYRSQAEIVKLAEDSINNNDLPSKKEMIPFLLPGEKPHVVKSMNEDDQGKHIAKKIMQFKSEGIPYSEMAILLRTNSLTKSLEVALTLAGIPHKVVGGLSFFERAQTRDMLAFLRFITNPKDEVAFSRLLNLFEGLGAKSIEKIYNHLKINGYDLYSLDPIKVKVKLTTPAYEGLKSFYESLVAALDFEDIESQLSSFTRTFYNKYLLHKYDDSFERKKDVEILILSSKEYTDAETFLNEMALEVDKEMTDNEETVDEVSLLTVHKSKGLEWDVVFMPYVVDSIFPLHKCIIEGTIEEERRLFYVAITRARKHLYMYQLYDLKYKADTFGKSIFVKELSLPLYNYLTPGR